MGLLSSACASAVNEVHVAAVKQGESLYAITVENIGKDAVKFSIYVEISDGGQWVEYPHRLEDGLLESQRKIHSLKGGGEFRLGYRARYPRISDYTCW